MPVAPRTREPGCMHPVAPSSPCAEVADTRSRTGSRRLRNTPHLARVVPHLPAETPHPLACRCGLDASFPIVAAATREQLSPAGGASLRSVRSECMSTLH